LLIPLGSGIKAVDKRFVVSGQSTKVKVTAYNTFFTEDKDNLTARIRISNSLAICAKAVDVINQNELELTFQIPQGKAPIDTTIVSGKNKTALMPLLEIYGNKTGKASLENAFSFRDSSGTEATKESFCQVEQYKKSSRMTFPFINILEETARNLYFHVPMWFGMMAVLLVSVIYSVRFLFSTDSGNNNSIDLQSLEKSFYLDRMASAFAVAGVLYGILGLVTGAMWARYTWGEFWSGDVKQNMSAVALLIYLAYFVLRSSLEDPEKKARISAVYNVFAFASLIPLLYIIPRFKDSLHPGAEGNPAFKSYDLDSMMRLVFYPANIAWILLAVWIATLIARISALENEK
jgi:heme exporter protein C